MWKHDSPDYPDSPSRCYRSRSASEPRWSHCPSCGASLEQDHLFCSQCGTKSGIIERVEEGGPCRGCKRQLSAKEKFCPHCGKAADRSALEKSHCSTCKAILPKSASFCVGCGKKL